MSRSGDDSLVRYAMLHLEQGLPGECPRRSPLSIGIASGRNVQHRNVQQLNEFPLVEHKPIQFRL